MCNSVATLPHANYLGWKSDHIAYTLFINPHGNHIKIDFPCFIVVLKKRHNIPNNVRSVGKLVWSNPIEWNQTFKQDSLTTFSPMVRLVGAISKSEQSMKARSKIKKLSRVQGVVWVRGHGAPQHTLLHDELLPFPFSHYLGVANLIEALDTLSLGIL